MNDAVREDTGTAAGDGLTVERESIASLESFTSVPVNGFSLAAIFWSSCTKHPNKAASCENTHGV